MPANPNVIGTRAEVEVAAACVRAGMDVFVPLLNAQGRVDLVVADGNRLIRLQCKAATMRGTVVFFRCCSNTRNSPKGYIGEVDAFGIYSPHLDRSYLVPIDEVPERGCHLRTEPTRNNQERGIRWAADYEIRPAT